MEPGRISDVLKQEDIERFRQRLEAERAETAARIAARGRDVEATVRDQDGAGDAADESTLLFDRETALEDADLERDTLERIEEALRRIEAGTYGISEVSGRPIPIDRLEAVPYATTLVEERLPDSG
jgi:RNA polymerase-binding transcription factor